MAVGRGSSSGDDGLRREKSRCEMKKKTWIILPVGSTRLTRVPLIHHLHPARLTTPKSKVTRAHRTRLSSSWPCIYRDGQGGRQVRSPPLCCLLPGEDGWRSTTEMSHATDR